MIKVLNSLVLINGFGENHLIHYVRDSSRKTDDECKNLGEKRRSTADEVFPIKPSSADPIRWLFIVAIIIAMFVPHLYEEQKHIEPVAGECILSAQLTTSVNAEPRQIAGMQPKADPSLGKMLDESNGANITPSLREEYPTESPGRKSLSVHGKKKEALLHPIIIRAANRYQVDPALVKAIIMVESSYNPKAISRRGARGLMQLMPTTAEALGVGDSFNPEQNINAGVRHFRSLLNQFEGNVKLALAAYNAGSRKVRKYEGVPPFKATRYYINKVLEYHQYYREMMAS